ncbi:MAG: ribosome silencing factor [Spirochaetaceae bacterium]|nr:MAG: ribosome silencing factor [Spirochaetaceae bacterium]
MAPTSDDRTTSASGESLDREAIALDCARTLDEHKARNTIALAVGEICSFTDYLVISTANSAAHARGLQKQLQSVFEQYAVNPLNGSKRQQDNSWTLIDLGFVVVHIMTAEARAFYELERLWFSGRELFHSVDEKADGLEPSERQSSKSPSVSS